MLRSRRLGLTAWLLLLLPGSATAQDYETRWSATLETRFQVIAGEEASDDVTGFFDQYWFTNDKDNSASPELGFSEASFDLLAAEETPVLQFRLASPTSNLGLVDGEDPFVNQRALLLGRLPGLFLDLQYWRFRTENLRQFVDPSGSALTYTDLTSPDDRFFERRTGFGGTLRFRPQDAFEDLPASFTRLGSELELRGGYGVRKGEVQESFLLPPTNDWLSNDLDIDQSVGDVGGGLLVAPGGLFTLALDGDHDAFRNREPTLTDADLGAPYPSTNNTIGFVPDTNRNTGALRFHSRIGDRATIRGGFQASVLEQVGDLTPRQSAAGLDHNKVVSTSANLAADVQLLEALSANAFFKYEARNNEIDRDTPLFNAQGGTQVDEFLDDWSRYVVGGELVYRFLRRNQVSVGVRGEWVDRDLDFVTGVPGQRILPANALVADDTKMVTVYARTRLRPFPGLELRGEIGYRDAPETGYILDLEHYVYGRADVSYVLPISRPVIFSALVRGSSGDNDDFDAVSGLGANPSGARVGRDFESDDISWGITATASPWNRITLFSFFFQSWGSQDYDLILSDLPRYFQDTVPITFASDGPVHYRSEDLGLVAGVNVALTKETDAALSYTFNTFDARYRSSGSTNVQTIDSLNRVEGNIHRYAVTLRQQLLEGLGVAVGYRFDRFKDHSPVHGTGVVPPFGLTTHQHTITLAISFSDAILH